MKRYIAIGDIHGAADRLERLLSRIDPQPDTDTLVFLGDYVDRGSMTFEVVERLIEIGHRFPSSVFLKGNHEQMLLDFLDGRGRQVFMENGGIATLDSYLRHQRHGDGRPVIPERHLSFFKTLALFHETADYIFVHGGLRPPKPLWEQDPEDLIWIREPFLSSRHDFGKRVIFGHTPFPEPLVMDNKIGIDTGAGYDRALTCVVLPETTFISI